MSGVNKVILVGRLGQDPELKYTSNGKAVCNFTMATSENWTDRNGQKQERTEWHRIVVWDKLAELCNQYLSKGRQAYLEGRLQTRSWEGKDGQKKYTTEILGNTVQFLGGSPSNSSSTSSDNYEYNQGAPQQGQSMAPQQQASQGYNVDTDSSFASDDIPF